MFIDIKSIVIDHKLLSRNSLHFHTNSPTNVRLESEIAQTDLITCLVLNGLCGPHCVPATLDFSAKLSSLSLIWSNHFNYDRGNTPQKYNIIINIRYSYGCNPRRSVLAIGAFTIRCTDRCQIDYFPLR